MVWILERNLMYWILERNLMYCDVLCKLCDTPLYVISYHVSSWYLSSVFPDCDRSQPCQDLNSHLEEREQQFGQRVQMARASEVEVLAEAWRMSGELRSELDAVRSGEAAPPSQDSSARQALQDLRELRQRYNDMLG